MNLTTLNGLPPGVHAISADAVVDRLGAARLNGYCIITLDLSACRDKQDLLELFAQALHFPDWFGHNWDAFADCLLDLDWFPASGHVLHLSNCSGIANASPEIWEQATAIMAETIQQRAQHNLPLWVFCDHACAASESPDR